MSLAAVPPAPTLFGVSGALYRGEDLVEQEPGEAFDFVWRRGVVDVDVFEETQETPEEQARVRRSGKVRWGWSVNYHLGDTFEQIVRSEGAWSSTPQEAALGAEHAVRRLIDDLVAISEGRP